MSTIIVIAALVLVFGAIGRVFRRRDKPLPTLAIKVERAPSNNSYPSWIAGLNYRGRDGTDRETYCATLHVGDEVYLTLETDNTADPAAVAIHHEDRHIGYIPRRHQWVHRALSEDDTLRTVIDKIELFPDDGNRARYVGIMITVVSDRYGRKR